jgi:hypothetical protein
VSAVTTRVRGLAPWAPRKETRDLIVAIRSVLAEYVAYLPLTLRQIFYRLVGGHDFAKTEKAYARLGEHLNRARRAGLIPFASIRDDGITKAEPLAWEDANHLVRSFVKSAQRFRLDRQVGQPRRLLFAVEAAGMLPMVERVADPFGITVQSAGGFDSTTGKYNLADELGRFPEVEVIHIGDHGHRRKQMHSARTPRSPRLGRA